MVIPVRPSVMPMLGTSSSWVVDDMVSKVRPGVFLMKGVPRTRCRTSVGVVMSSFRALLWLVLSRGEITRRPLPAQSKFVVVLPTWGPCLSMGERTSTGTGYCLPLLRHR